MRKRTIFALAVLVVFVVSAGMALAAQDVSNPAQKGSLIIYSKIVVARDPAETGPVTVDTVVTIANDWTNLIDVKCYWVDEDQEVQDFVFRMTRSQVAWWRASDGAGMVGREAVVVPPFEGEYGELKCWAVTVEGDTQVNHNHLFGTATIYDYAAGTAWEYSSWNFAARTDADGKPGRGKPIGDPGQLRLTGENDGRSYDACPQYVLGIFMSDDSSFTDNDGNIVDLSTTDLTLVPCRQDLRQDRTPTVTKAQFDIWNEDEVKSTGAWLCFKCWIETPLRGDPVRSLINPDGATAGYIGHRNFDKFDFRSLHTTYGVFRVTGVASTVCKYTTGGITYPSVKSPLIGVLSKRVTLNGDPASSGTHLNTAGKFPYSALDPVLVQWDVQDPHPESNQR